MQLFFLGGAHGTGKTTLARELCDRLPAKLLTASQLIREEGTEPSEPDKRVGDISGNQDRLLRAIQRHRTRHATILLDGHYCVRSMSGEPAAIACDVFQGLAPDALLLLEEQPSAVAQRLSLRDGVEYGIDNVIAQIKCERCAAQTVSTALTLPLHVLKAPGALEHALDFLIPRLG